MSCLHLISEYCLVTKKNGSWHQEAYTGIDSIITGQEEDFGKSEQKGK